MTERDKIIKQTVSRLQAIQTIDEFIAARDEILDLVEKVYKSGLDNLKAYFKDMFSMTPEQQKEKSMEFQDENYLLSTEVMKEFERLDNVLGDHESIESFIAGMKKRIEPYLEEAAEYMAKIMGGFMGDMMGSIAGAMGMEKADDESRAQTGASEAAEKIQKEIQGALDSEGRRDQKEFAKTVEGWSSAPRMTYETQIKADEASVWIGPSGSEEMVDKWRRIDEGTEPRSWTSATTMVFPFQGRGQSYIAKTKPRQFSSAGSWKKLGPITRTHNIHDHSIEAREWSKTLGEQRIKPFADDIQQAINRGLA